MTNKIINGLKIPIIISLMGLVGIILIFTMTGLRANTDQARIESRANSDKIIQHDGRFELMKARFDQIEKRFDSIDVKLDKIETTIDKIEDKIK